jgi:uncharacterized membrane protein
MTGRDKRSINGRLLTRLVFGIISLGVIQLATFYLYGSEWSLFRGILSIVMVILGFLSIAVLLLSIRGQQGLINEGEDWTKISKQQQERLREEAKRSGDSFYSQ